MKKVLRNYLFTLFSIYVTSRLVSSFSIAGGYETLIYGALILTVLNMFLRPVVNLIVLPLSFLSLGLISWLVNVLFLYGLTVIVPNIKLTAWKFPGFQSNGFVLPTVDFNLLVTFIITSLIITFIINFLNWLISK